MITGKRKCSQRITEGRKDFEKSSDLPNGGQPLLPKHKMYLGDMSHMLTFPALSVAPVYFSN